VMWRRLENVRRPLEREARRAARATGV